MGTLYYNLSFGGSLGFRAAAAIRASMGFRAVVLRRGQWRQGPGDEPSVFPVLASLGKVGASKASSQKLPTLNCRPLSINPKPQTLSQHLRPYPAEHQPLRADAVARFTYSAIKLHTTAKFEPSDIFPDRRRYSE